MDNPFDENYIPPENVPEEESEEIKESRFKKEAEVILADRGIYINHSQMPRRDYLKNLTKIEQNNIVQLFKDINSKFNKSGVRYGVLAIGTTTYQKRHWKGLEELFSLPNATFLEQVVEPGGAGRTKGSFDPKKVLEDEGNDLDFMIVKEYGPHTRDKIRQITRIALEENNYKFIETRRSTEGGSSYWTIPSLQMLKEGEPVTIYRTKEKTYTNAQTLLVRFPEGRPCHIYFWQGGNLEEKIVEEKREGYPFSILYRLASKGIYELEKTIKHGQQTGIYENPAIIEYCKRNNMKLDDLEF